MAQQSTSRGWQWLGLVALSVCWLTNAAQAADASPELIDQVIGLLSNSDREFRAAGLDVVRTGAKGTAATQKFAAHLEKLEPATQAALVTALGVRGDQAARGAVLALAGSQQEEVRAAVWSALGDLGEAADIAVLVKALGSGSDPERQAARTGLTRLRGAAVNSGIAKESKSAAPPVRTTLLEILATRRAAAETSTFIAASTNDDVGVRVAAVNGLGQVGNPAQLAEMLPAVLKATRGGERDNAERQLAAVCSRIENDDQRADALIAALNKIPAADRDQLLPLVGRVGGKRLINFVADIARGDDPARRTLAIDALSKWPDASPADKLLEIANQTANTAERQQAFQGYVKISATRDHRSDKERLDRMKQAMSQTKTPEEKTFVINRARTAYDVETLRFVLPFVDQAAFAQIACETIVELAHHREVREPNKAEFDKALDLVIKTSKDDEVIERAQKYKRGETWVRPKK